jgi:hypothetical protein
LEYMAFWNGGMGVWIYDCVCLSFDKYEIPDSLLATARFDNFRISIALKRLYTAQH